MRHALDGVLPPEICWNPDKADPARFEPLLDAFAGAAPALRRVLATRTEPPSRARYVHMPRLLERLDTDRFRPDRWLMPTWKALQLLDF